MTIYQEYRKLFVEALERRLAHHKMKPPIALCLSGGVDSTIVLFALLELGYEPKDILCVTFTLGEGDNPDSRCAEKICEHFKVPLLKTGCIQDDDVLLKDVYYLVDTLETYKPTSIQFVQPFIYISTGLNALGINQALIGYRADAMYGSSKEATFIHYREGEEAFRQHRRDSSELESKTNLWEVNLIGDDFGVFYVDAYHDEQLRGFVLALDKNQIWKGRIKILPYKAFIDYYGQGAFLREPCPMQIGTGIRAWHETLLSSKYNKRYWKRMDKVYEEVIKNMKKEEFK